MTTEAKHVSVLLNECIENLNIKPGGVYLDGTLGLGGQPQPKPQEKAEAAENILPVTSNIIIEQRRSDE